MPILHGRRDTEVVLAEAAISVPCIKQFKELFPGAKTWIGFPASVRYTPETEKEVMETVYLFAETGVYHRYVLWMCVPLKLTKNRRHIASFKEPGFTMQEVEVVFVSKDDQASINFSPFLAEFNYQQFKALKEQHGDFSATGISLITDRPIKNFDRALSTPRL